MKVLFLDIDGVLNGHEHDPEVLCGRIYPHAVVILNGVLRVTGAKVVLSSAWRYIVHRGEANLQGMDWLLRSHGVLAGRLIGVTRPDTLVRGVYSGRPDEWPVENERGQQITDWLGENGHTGPYAVVDDLDLGITAAGHPFVQTDDAIGLTPDDGVRLIKLLEGRVAA